MNCVGNKNDWYWLGTAGYQVSLTANDLTLAANGKMSVNDNCQVGNFLFYSSAINRLDQILVKVNSDEPGNTKRGNIIVPLTSCFTSLESAE